MNTYYNSRSLLRNQIPYQYLKTVLRFDVSFIKKVENLHRNLRCFSSLKYKQCTQAKQAGNLNEESTNFNSINDASILNCNSYYNESSQLPQIDQEQQEPSQSDDFYAVEYLQLKRQFRENSNVSEQANFTIIREFEKGLQVQHYQTYQEEVDFQGQQYQSQNELKFIEY
ncbi:unnamed protein product [Paramecium octaurelia]|uniref:Uncharacterized protein n=1 Tax=Paramecium octaurelia TaxID=43137 RepID=A0A8S1TW96_PAROT|nr:unnamed protein product [Paramecium octaurelia]CAD8156185.1 unnamed protein product [Paramecium octaurelia]